jgi:hypothetical protein
MRAILAKSACSNKPKTMSKIGREKSTEEEAKHDDFIPIPSLLPTCSTFLDQPKARLEKRFLLPKVAAANNGR